ncbi:T9SS type A sorting domain-containing protein [Pontibacter pudoricolor]|uniref:T9SS type A sorting domain-containing protein n=1 Tax=Pontibacter pudoricolor TaxID=2694930 RepID=UPI001391EB9E|nr:T9SS type A sorting domain-containing protein [Pontibacter pudoricolor]
MKQFYLLSAAVARRLIKNKCLLVIMLLVSAVGFTAHAQQMEGKETSACNTIDFENSSTGFIKSVNTGAGVVHISNKMRNADGTYAEGNYASVFNTASPTGDDWDLWTPDWGHVLIINQDLNPEPNDNAWGGEMTLDFSAIGPVTMTSMKALDFDAYENNSWVYLYDGQGNELHKVKIENLGNMSQQTVDLGNTKGVMKMKVVLDGINEHGMLAGSGAIDDIMFCKEEVVTPPSTCATLSFSQEAPGLITSTSALSGKVLIDARKRNEDGTYATANHASVFNTASPTGDDWDLYTPDWGHVLIINQDLGTEPNDNAWGGEITLDFSAIGPVTMTSMKALDFDAYENKSWVYLYDGAGNELHKVKIQSLGNMSQQVVDLGNTKGVMKMKVVLDGINEHGMLAGSGAIDDIVFCKEEVEENEPPHASAGADKTLTCAVTEVTLDGSSSTPGAVYRWSGVGGFTSSLATPTVQQAGTYTLTVTDPATGLTASDNVVVSLSNDVPFVRIQDFWENQPLTCNNPVYHVEAYTTTANAIYKWTGPDGFTSDKAAVGFTVEGTYTLTITDPVTGCQASESIKITQFYAKISVNAGPDKVLTCKEQTVTLQATMSGANNIIWYSPDGGNFVTPDHYLNAIVDKPGTYIIKATDLVSGCFVTDTVVVTLDMEEPNITAQGGTLNSETGTVQLMGSSTTDNVTYSWTGPEGFTSSEQNTVVSVAGDYTLTVTDQENGCSATMTVEVQSQPMTETSAISQLKAFPNPIVSKGAVEFKLLTTGNYSVELYDLKGNLIRELKAGHATAGELVNVELDGNGLKGGLYIARIISANESKTIKIILRK